MGFLSRHPDVGKLQSWGKLRRKGSSEEQVWEPSLHSHTMTYSLARFPRRCQSEGILRTKRGRAEGKGGRQGGQEES